MASLESIRKRSGLLIGFIGLALLAFVLGDFLNGGSSIFGGGKPIVGEINGQEIDYKEFEIELRDLSQLQPQADQDQLRAGLWNDKVNSILLGDEYEKAGLSITSEELASNTIGYNNREVSPIVKRFFGIQPGQEVSNAQLSAGIAQLKEQDPTRWAEIEKQIAKQLMVEKLNTLVSRSYMVSNLESETKYKDQTTTASGKYAYADYQSVAKENKEVTDADIQKYFEENKENFKQEGTVKINYAVFSVAPTAGDNSTIKNELLALKGTQVVWNEKFKVNDTIKGFEDTDEMAAFLYSNSDIQFNPSYVPAGALSSEIDSLMHKNEIGFVYGPYFENGMYKMARLMDVRNDSVQVAIFAKEVVASDATDKAVFNNASNFVMTAQADGFDAAVKNIGSGQAFDELVSKDAAQLPGIGKDRQIVRWAFNEDTQPGSIKRFDLGDKYIIARFEKRFEKGYADFNSIKEQLRPAAENEKAKAYLLSKVNAATSVDAAAQALGTSVAPFSGLTLQSNGIEGVQFDPIAVGAIMGLTQGQVSKPIAGTTGVFVAIVDSKVEGPKASNVANITSQTENAFVPKVNYELVKSLRDQADIVDNRPNFY
jgi:hypothetical protein